MGSRKTRFERQSLLQRFHSSIETLLINISQRQIKPNPCIIFYLKGFFPLDFRFILFPQFIETQRDPIINLLGLSGSRSCQVFPKILDSLFSVPLLHVEQT